MEPGKKNGALVGLIVIIVILAIGGLYVWMSNKSSPATSQAVTSQDAADLNTLDASLQTTNTSTGVNASAVK